jgi:hypothetical protein
MPEIATVAPAPAYARANDLCIITCYFNPEKYKTKKKNFEKFIAPIAAAGLHHIIVECAFNEAGFELPDSPNVIRVNSNAVLWQKERLLNIALDAIPAECSKIAWLDCDILFSNEQWAIETSVLLEKHPVVQPFEHAVRLPEHVIEYTGEGHVYNGFAAVYSRYPETMRKGHFELHGHTGFAWAAKKEVFRGIGFYDACLSGVADHLMAHSFLGDWHCTCVQRLFLENEKYFAHFEEWSRKIYERIRGNIGFAPGVVLHLWHGDHLQRRYLENSQFLSQTPFNPPDDLYLNDSQCWEIRENRELLTDWTQFYLSGRRED